MAIAIGCGAGVCYVVTRMACYGLHGVYNMGQDCQEGLIYGTLFNTEVWR